MTTFNQAQLRNDLVGLAHNIEAGYLLRDQKEKVLDILHADHYNINDGEISYNLNRASTCRTKKYFTAYISRAMKRISVLVDDFKIANGSHCKTCRFKETKYDTLFECHTHRVQCVRCDEQSAHETREDYEAKRQASQDAESKAMSNFVQAVKAEEAKLTDKEEMMLVAIAEHGCSGMGGEEPKDLHDDNYSWFRAEDLVNLVDISIKGVHAITGLMSSLDSKGYIMDDGKDWFLTDEGIDAAQARWDKDNKTEASTATLYYNPSKKHYYEIDRTMDHFCNSDLATDYLTKVIDDSSPDYFHWTDIEMANELRDNDGDLTPVKRDRRYNMPALKEMCKTLADRVETAVQKGIRGGYAAISRGQQATEFPEEPVHAAWVELINELNATEAEIQRLNKRLHGLEMVKAITLLHQEEVTEEVMPEPTREVVQVIDECIAIPPDAKHAHILQAPITGYVEGRPTDQLYRMVTYFMDNKWCIAPQQAFKGVFDEHSGLPAWNLETVAGNSNDFIYIDAGTKWGIMGLAAAKQEAIQFAQAFNRGEIK